MSPTVRDHRIDFFVVIMSKWSTIMFLAANLVKMSRNYKIHSDSRENRANFCNFSAHVERFGDATVATWVKSTIVRHFMTERRFNDILKMKNRAQQHRPNEVGTGYFRLIHKSIHNHNYRSLFAILTDQNMHSTIWWWKQRSDSLKCCFFLLFILRNYATEIWMKDTYLLISSVPMLYLLLMLFNSSCFLSTSTRLNALFDW